MERLSKADVGRTYRWFTHRIITGKPDGWTNEVKQRNFEEFARITTLTGVSFEGASCLDVGCGTGDLVPFLRSRGINRYVGVDLFQPAIDRARAAYPDEEFVQADFLTFETDERFDFAFASGVATVKLESDNRDFVKALASKMWDMTTVGFGINFLLPLPHDEKKFPNIRSYTVEEVEELCREVCQAATLSSHGYLLESDDPKGVVFVYREKPLEI